VGCRQGFPEHPQVNRKILKPSSVGQPEVNEINFAIPDYHVGSGQVLMGDASGMKPSHRHPDFFRHPSRTVVNSVHVPDFGSLQILHH